MEKESQSKLIDFDEKDIKGEVEIPSIARKYTGKTTSIEGYELREGNIDGKPSYYFIVSTKKLGTETFNDKDTKEEKTIEVRATRLFGIKKDEEGKFYWSSASDLANFLKKYKKSTVKELVGVKVMTAVTEKKGKEYLSFI